MAVRVNSLWIYTLVGVLRYGGCCPTARTLALSEYAGRNSPVVTNWLKYCASCAQ